MIRPAALGFLLLMAVLPVCAVERSLRIEAPPTVWAGQSFRAVVTAATNAGQGEQVGMFQLDVSVDGGRTWTPARYLDKLGPSTTQPIDLKAGLAGSTVRVRVRVAFRGGLAGDVDYRGAAIRWNENWDRWLEPPVKSAVIKVLAP